MANIIGQKEDEVLENLTTWLDTDHGLQFQHEEVVRHIVQHPKEHFRELERIAHQELTYSELKERLVDSEPQDWSYPAISWNTVRRSRRLKDETVLKRREAEVQALKEEGFTHNEIGSIMGVEKGTIDEYSRRINDRLQRARATVRELE